MDADSAACWCHGSVGAARCWAVRRARIRRQAVPVGLRGAKRAGPCGCCRVARGRLQVAHGCAGRRAHGRSREA
eukprot:5375100-Alexandrium_andersonii.AAC.1